MAKQNPQIGKTFDLEEARFNHDRTMNYVAIALGLFLVAIAGVMFTTWGATEIANRFTIARTFLAFGLGLFGVAFAGDLNASVNWGPLTMTGIKGFGLVLVVLFGTSFIDACN